ncbi:DUF3320 domain-containing protein [Ferrimonas marina]|uniref:AAA domain-containing protein n=1 Tax=Ferrimonas marina TaxID=299255 RepID=A0A1M5Z453_9GAMM|nr:DUF3320 domain-containing protein [Ferrimonas marina]SHI18989.1 AAA domain-containing protein [Ferrimonas marina]
MESRTRQQLDSARQELLDMGLRGNALLSFRHSARRTLEILDESPQPLYDALVEQGKALSFAPLPPPWDAEQAETPSEEALVKHLDALKGEKRHQDRLLQTRLKPKPLDTRLRRIANEAQSCIQEMGIDILYLALGFLHWRSEPDQVRRAPLVLIPVRLQRNDARSRYQLVYSGTELGENLVLEAKLASDFDLTLPRFDSETSLQSYFDQVAEAVAGESQWQVAPQELALGFFAFGKFRMYQDLSQDQWGLEQLEGSLLNRLFDQGFAPIEPESADTPLCLIKDADASQSEAVQASGQAEGLVIQGPPGTGKSQTISNIIGQALSEDKSVLFVSEKMAALEVVKRRLDACHLGHAVLELHSHKSNKRSVLSSIADALAQGQPQSPDRTEQWQQLEQLEQQLARYADKVNQPVGQSGVPFADAVAEAMSLRQQHGDDLPKVPFHAISGWDESQYRAQLQDTEALVAQLEKMGPPCDHPFAGSELQSFSPQLEQHLSMRLASAEGRLKGLLSKLNTLSEAMAIAPADSLNEAERLLLTARQWQQAPDLSGVESDDPQWSDPQILAQIGQGQRLQALTGSIEQRFVPTMVSQPVLSLRQQLQASVGKWWRWLSPGYHRAKQQLTGLLRTPLSQGPGQWVQWLDEVLEYQKLEQELAGHSERMGSLFGQHWRGQDSDWPLLQAQATWLEHYHGLSQRDQVDPELLLSIRQDDASPLPEGALAGAEHHMEQWQQAVESLSQLLQYRALIEDSERSWPQWQQLLGQWQQAEGLYELARFNQLRHQLNLAGLATLTSKAFRWREAPERLCHGLALSWYEGWAAYAYEHEPELSLFDRLSQERAAAQYRNLAGQAQGFHQEALTARLYQHLPSAMARGEVALLRKECSKKRRHLPIRQLMSKAGRAVQQIKPVFMMSPMSVATYLPAEAMEFDLVVFDEASQVKVADALGALLRGRQAIVVGDTQQMPPTDFFQRAFELDDEAALDSDSADVESILSLFLTKGAPQRMLRWHYRSRDESLIAVSNQAFYQNRLVVFPSAGQDPDAAGLSLTHLPNTQYQRGSSRTNPEEASAVAQAVMHHAQQRPQRSLGVVAFSTAQREAIIEALESLRQASPQLEPFFQQHEEEPFFVKNLENVQGDERDSIFISLGYGRSEDGALRQNFGPLNQQGGERRLNVLITRARRQMRVFSNFIADELTVTENTPQGVRALQQFLRFAADPRQVQAQAAVSQPGGALARWLHQQAAQQHTGQTLGDMGTCGVYIDAALADSHQPHRYLLAVEGDGRNYASAASVYDRERTRPAVLEGLGWRRYRSWSVDWYRQPITEQERLNRAIAEAQAAAQQPLDSEVEPAASAQGAEIVRLAPAPNSALTQPYQAFDPRVLRPRTAWELTEDSQLQSELMQILALESPIHEKRLVSLICQAYGLSRASSKIRERVERLLTSAKPSPGQQAPFWFHPEQGVRVRDRTGLEAPLRKLEWISDAELSQALLLAVEHSLQIRSEAAMDLAMDLLGFQRLSASAKSRLALCLAQLLDSGRLQQQGETLSLAASQ